MSAESDVDNSFRNVGLYEDKSKYLAGIYARISVFHQESDSIKNQIALADRYAKLNDMVDYCKK